MLQSIITTVSEVRDMLLTGYSLEIFKSKCNPKSARVRCFAHLENDVREVLPFLITVLGGGYKKEPPALTLKNCGKLITIYPKKIAINALRDGEEAEKIVAWLQREINETWEKQHKIEPSIERMQQPALIEVLKLLPKTDCKQCNERTCLLFAAQVVEGRKDHNGCPLIEPNKRLILNDYLSQFRFE
jgi:ArsR family metal-binding transcriptional regulator